MYHRRNKEKDLEKFFNEICSTPDEAERIKLLDELFHLNLNCHHTYELLFFSTDPISISVKDTSTDTIYDASFENYSPLLKEEAAHIKFININIHHWTKIERSQTYYRFQDTFTHPVHDEFSAMFDGRYRLTLIRKDTSWYRPVEGGVYIILSDTQNYYTLYQEKLRENNKFFKTIDVTSDSFDLVFQKFVQNKDVIFNRIMTGIK